MKIRTDFVTNSSSVSYIITMNKDMVDIYKKNFISHSDEKTKEVLNLLYNDMVKNGTRVMLEGKELYTKLISFRTDGDCMFDDSYGKPIEEVDFSKFTNEELWSYIYGEYILNGKIGQICGLGATKVETY